MLDYTLRKLFIRKLCCDPPVERPHMHLFPRACEEREQIYIPSAPCSRDKCLEISVMLIKYNNKPALLLRNHCSLLGALTFCSIGTCYRRIGRIRSRLLSSCLGLAAAATDSSLAKKTEKTFIELSDSQGQSVLQ